MKQENAKHKSKITLQAARGLEKAGKDFA